MPTPKQEAFARNVVEGMNPLEAYKAAGYKADGQTGATEAQRLMKHPDIAPMIEEGKREAMSRASWNRREAMERMRAVNDAALSCIGGGDMGANVLRAFFDSAAALDRLADIGFQMASIRAACDYAEKSKFSFDEETPEDVRERLKAYGYDL